jgi:hypothetical protein
MGTFKLNFEFSESGIRLKSDTIAAKGLHALFLIIPGVLYFLTAARTPGWVDTTLVVSYVTRLGLSSWVNSHNLFNLLGNLWLRLFPSDNIFFYLTLLGGVFGSITVYFSFRTVLDLTENMISAGIAALLLMVSHSLWWHSTEVEVYTLSSALMMVMLFFIVRYELKAEAKYLYLAAFFFGLACTNHLQMGLFVFPFVVLALMKLVRPHPHRNIGAQIGIAILCFLAGISLYVALWIRDVVEAAAAYGSLSEGFRNVYEGATGGEFKQLMFTAEMPARLKRFWRFSFVFWLVYNFPSPALAMAVFGFWDFWKRKSLRFLFTFFLVGFVAQVLWSANYYVWDMYAFAQPVYVMLSIPIGLTAERLLRSRKALRVVFLILVIPMLLLPGFIYGRMHGWYQNVAFFNRYFNTYPQIPWTRHTWDPVEFIVDTNKRNYEKVERYADAIFSILPQGAYLLNSDSRSDYPLRYYYRDLYQVRTDINHVSIFSPFLTAETGNRLAGRLKTALDRGDPVYSSSILYPEKVILDQLFLLYDPSTTLEEVQSLSEAEYLRRFPGVRFEKIVMFEEEQIWIYRLVPRER